MNQIEPSFEVREVDSSYQVPSLDLDVPRLTIDSDGTLRWAWDGEPMGSWLVYSSQPDGSNAMLSATLLSSVFSSPPVGLNTPPALFWVVGQLPIIFGEDPTYTAPSNKVLWTPAPA